MARRSSIKMDCSVHPFRKTMAWLPLRPGSNGYRITEIWRSIRSGPVVAFHNRSGDYNVESLDHHITRSVSRLCTWCMAIDARTGSQRINDRTRFVRAAFNSVEIDGRFHVTNSVVVKSLTRRFAKSAANLVATLVTITDYRSVSFSQIFYRTVVHTYTNGEGSLNSPLP